MTPYEQKLLEKYLAHLNIVGDEGDYPDFESWYQAIRYAHKGQGRRGPWKKRQNCATRTSWMQPGSSPAKGESRIRVEQVIPKTRRRNDLIR